MILELERVCSVYVTFTVSKMFRNIKFKLKILLNSISKSFWTWSLTRRFAQHSLSVSLSDRASVCPYDLLFVNLTVFVHRPSACLYIYETMCMSFWLSDCLFASRYDCLVFGIYDFLIIYYIVCLFCLSVNCLFQYIWLWVSVWGLPTV